MSSLFLAPPCSAPPRAAVTKVRTCNLEHSAKLRMRARLFSDTVRKLVGQQGAAQLLNSGPFLLQHRPEKILTRIRFITELTGIPESQALPLAVRNAHVLLWDPGTLRDRWENLQAETGFDLAAMQVMVRKNPGLLFYSPFSLRRKVNKLQGLLHCTQPQVMKAVRKHPHLLAVRTSTAMVHLSSLATLLGVTPQAAAKIIRKQPALLSYSPPTLQSKLALLATLLHLPLPKATPIAARHPSLLCRTPSSLHANLAHLQTLLDPTTPLPPLQLSPPPPPASPPATTTPAPPAPPAAAVAAARCPTLLTLSPSTVASRYHQLANFLDLSPPPPPPATSTLSALVRRAPPLLQLPPATLASKLLALQRTFSTSAPGSLEMVCAMPTLFCLSSETIDAKWRGLREAAEGCEGWRWQLALSPNKTRALMVCRSLEGSLERLRVLTESGLQEEVPITTAVCSSKKQFDLLLQRKLGGAGGGGVGGAGG